MTPVAQRKSILETRQSELEVKIVEIDVELVSHNSRDWEELAVERETDEVLEGMGISAQEEIRAIKAALNRIDVGEYGGCVKCGAPISDERLDVIPFTPFCRNCAALNPSATL